jgi:hypothetical protein
MPRLLVLAASAAALAPRRAPVKPTQFFRGRFDGKQFRTEPLEAATFDEFSTDEGAAAPGNPQLFTADGAPLMTAPCCIKVVGVGGGGGNAVNRMVETDAGSFVDFWAMNTDAQASSRCYGAFTSSIRLVSRNDGSAVRAGALAIFSRQHDEHRARDDARVGCGWDP